MEAMRTTIDAVLEHAARRDPMHDAPMLVRFNPDVVAQAAADLARLRSLLVEARDALRGLEGAHRYDGDDDTPACPVCFHARGHYGNCSLAALLARLDEEVGKP